MCARVRAHRQPRELVSAHAATCGLQHTAFRCQEVPRRAEDAEGSRFSGKGAISNGGASLVHLLPQERRTGRTPHDPAWPSCSHDRATPAPVNGMLCARYRGADRHAHQSRRNQRYRLCDLARKPLPRHAHRVLCGSSRQALAHPEAQIPIGTRLRPAGSCMRDFRTPDGTRNPYMGMVNYKRHHVDIVMYHLRGNP